MVDALAALPAPEPPPSMWDGVKARLGQAEIEDAGRSRLALWWRRVRPQLMPAMGLAAAAAIAAVWISHGRGSSSDEATPQVAHAPAAPPPHAASPAAPPHAGSDVTDALAEDDAEADQAYRAAADELYADAQDARAEWSPSQGRTFDAKLAALQAAVAHTAIGPDRERAWQALIDYVQRAVVGVRVAEVP